jgi:HEAT repeat protein
MGADAAARRAAADDLERAVGQLPRAAQLDLLRDPSVNRRRCIAFYLVDRFDPADAATTGALLEAVADADPTVRHVALAAARRMAPAQLAGAVGRLGSLLAPEREDAAHRAAVARLLGGLGADAREALLALAQAQQKDPEAAVRSACLVAVTRIAEPAAQVEALRRSLTQDADPAVRGVAVVRLGKLGPAAAAAVPELAGTLDRADESLAPKAVEALIAIGAPAVPALIPRLKSPQATTRICAIVALGKIGPEAAAAAQPLEACMNDEDPQVRQWAAVALQRIRAPR